MKIENEQIEDVLNNQATAGDAHQVASWFATDAGQLYLAQRMDQESGSLTDVQADQWLDHAVASTTMRNRLFKQIHRRQKRVRIYWAAAILLPFLLLGGSAAFMADRLGVFKPIAYEEFYVPNGEQLQIVLQDGTKVQLNSDTRLRYPTKFGLFNRKVTLAGEGYFVVAKENKRPFIIDLAGVELKVTGTQLNVKAYPDDSDVYVLLDEGSVSIEDATATAYPLNPGDKACYNRLSRSCQITKPANLMEETAWKRNNLNFNHTPLKEVILTLTRQYDASFVVADSALLATRFTLSTSKVNLQDILFDLERISRIRFMPQPSGSYKIEIAK